LRWALVIVVASLLIIADVAYQRADDVRKRSGDALTLAVEDWEFATNLAVGIGLAGVGWAAAAAVPANRRLARLTHPIARYGAGAALVCGLAAVSVFGTLGVVFGGGLGERYHWECWSLIGTILGGLVGSAIGPGLGAAAYTSRRPPVAEQTDPERTHYQDGPEESAVGEAPASPS
jgi:hypothetical protein